MNDGRLNLRCAIDAIQLGHTYRQDLGDLDELCESIRTVGLLHPIVLGPDGLLISGLRRLKAVTRLGWRRVPVWVATEVSDRLLSTLAVQHENTLRKDFNPVEAAELYEELKSLYAAEAARRQASTRFGGQPAESGDTHGAVDSTAPQDARVQAARAITGRDSHGMLEQVVELRRIVDSDDVPAWLRSQTEHALAELSTDGKVNGRYLAIKTVQARHELEQAAVDPSMPATAREVAEAELEHLTEIAHPATAARETKRAAMKVREAATGRADTQTSARESLAVHRLVAIVTEHHGWWDTVDPRVAAEHLNDEQWELLTASLEAATAFIHAVTKARASRERERRRFRAAS